jgi:phosphate uptake regulator
MVADWVTPLSIGTIHNLFKDNSSIQCMMFKELFDAIFKGSILESAFEAADRMHEQAQSMYELSIKCLVENQDEIAKDISREDHVINVAVREVRREILEYLAIHSAPDISASLILTGIAVDYERIGDYCKNIAQLGLMYPAKLEPSPYFDIFKKMDDNIAVMFDFTLQSLKESDTKKARDVMKMHVTTKKLHADIISKLNKGDNITIQTAIVYALVTEFFRRISAHLQNIASTVVQPYHKVGFDKEKIPSTE